jgi:hypothetical protein
MYVCVFLSLSVLDRQLKETFSCKLVMFLAAQSCCRDLDCHLIHAQACWSSSSEHAAALIAT